MPSAVITFTPLRTELGLIHAHGVDAEKFLQGQFSNDLHALASGHGQWSSYSTAKGRMIANFYVQRDGDGFWLSLAADMADIVIERLRKFRMMAKLEIERGEPEFALFAVSGRGAGDLLGHALGLVAPETGNSGLVHNDRIITRLPWVNAEAFLIILPASRAEALSAGLTAAGARAGSAEDWRLQAIHAGVGMISSATTEKVIPQELNLEVLGGINFKKGCYPGQEIVARSHYLGKLKNQTYRISARAPLRAGEEIFSANMGEQSIGVVINTAPDPQDGFAALAVLRAANTGETLVAGTPDGTPLSLGKLPYTLPLDVAKEG
ncbi:CAF17-like 4Fe-4S cluster assembly/insertion protein YgfZ [Acidithiobacillus ferriphilus]|uniref:CAF17-like 4Fe-4S cluster assembly/insertion protein YgfZ n=1 Tax=Acidithiobacillus ferriphilus TaxID=1689834 RepID=UPI00232F3342|nr:folate-binding protein [Acidithiobacillus ferriphilus]WCE92740.1 folate-binding protein [Acidithiobacillus ferriphilus]